MMLSDYSHLVDEWHPDNPGAPSDFRHKSNKRVLWICKKNHVHVWSAAISDRTRGGGCPYCQSRKTHRDESLAAKRPDLAAEWGNNLKTPWEYSISSNARVNWACQHGHRWTTSINNRTSNGTGCPYCTKQKVTLENSLAAKFPEVANQFCVDNNISADAINVYTGKKFWWECSEGHRWMASVKNRTRLGRGCPYCANQRASATNNLAVRFPAIASEWSSKNGMSPWDVVGASNKKRWWKCSACGLEWESVVASRTTSGTGCPRCWSSKGEKAVLDVLASSLLKFERQFNARRIGGDRDFRYDFAVWKDDRVGMIEFHGEQHYIVVEFFGGQDALDNNIERDAAKLKICEKAGVPLLVIPYWAISNIEEIVTAFLREL